MVEDYKRLVEKYARKFSITSKLPRAELEQEGYLIVLEATASWDPTKGPLSSRIKYKLVCGLRNYTRRYYTVQRNNAEYSETEGSLPISGIDYRERHSTDIPSSDHFNPERLLVFKEAYQALSKDALEVLNLLMEEIDTSLPPRMIRGALKKAMRANNMSWSKIWDVFRELRAIAT